MPEKKVRVICPQCRKSAYIPIDIEIVKKKETGAFSIQIPIGLVCEHTFQAYLDKNLDVRDYLSADLNLLHQNGFYEAKKMEIIAKTDDFNLEYDNLIKNIGEKNLRTLIYAAYFGSPIVFIENDLDQERFYLIFVVLAKLVPDFTKLCKIMTPSKYQEYEKENANELNWSTVYNSIEKQISKIPFGETDPDVINEVLNVLKAGKFKVQRIMAKNILDYLVKFEQDIKVMGEEKIDKIVKKLKKSYPNQEKWITPQVVNALKFRMQFNDESLFRE